MISSPAPVAIARDLRRDRLPRRIVLALATCAACAAGVVRAESLVFEAITDFPVIDAGEVPYYRDLGAGRDVLAVNAAVVDFRDRFARAELVFGGPPARYDVRLVALGEIDGEGVYRVLVDGDVVATFTNAPVAIDYTPETHVVEDVALADGSVLAVESMATSNDTIPEGDGYAFARGRWRSLTLESTGPMPPDDTRVDLSLALTATATSLAVGDTVTLSVEVTNADPGAVATAPQVTLQLPEGVTGQAGGACSVDGTMLVCPLAEIAAGETRSLEVALSFAAAGERSVAVGVDSDQPERAAGDENGELVFTVGESEDAMEAPGVDTSGGATSGGAGGDGGAGTTGPGDGPTEGGSSGGVASGGVASGGSGSGTGGTEPAIGSDGGGGGGLPSVLSLLALLFGLAARGRARCRAPRSSEPSPVRA